MRLSAQKISHHYGALPVLDDISFDVGPGEVVAIVGPSGCGKSTLLRLLGGLERPTHGAAMLCGVPPAGSLNPLTYVFQEFALLPWRSAAGNVRLALESSGLSRAEQEAIVADVLTRTGLSDFAHSYPKQLSGGMRQRVGIARALAVRPAILLMDEPLSALDAQTRELLMDDLVRLIDGSAAQSNAAGASQNAAGLATVYVTHNLEEAVRLADRILVLSRRPGRLREVVTINTLRHARRMDSTEMAREVTRLWDLIRADASEADRELLTVGGAA